MCLSFCSVRGLLYWNHEDCHPLDCPLAPGPHGACQDCRHLQGATCGLTRAPLPSSGGCCHHNAELRQGLQAVTREMLGLLGIGPTEPEISVLHREEIPYYQDDQARLFIDLDAFILPFTFGLGTDHLADEPFWPE